MATSDSAESFRDLLLRGRGRSGLTQRELAERVGVHRRSVQEWEAGLTFPSTDRLETLVRALVEAHGFTPGQEQPEAEAMWTGELVGSGGVDGTLRLWETSTGRLLATLEGHTSGVYSIAMSASGDLIASGGVDGTVRIWESGSGSCLHVLRIDRRYERLDITRLDGITAAQRASLLELGAVEQVRP